MQLDRKKDYTSEQTHLLNGAPVSQLVQYTCYACSIRLLQPVSFLCYCTLQGWQRQLRGHMESEKGYCSSDSGLSQGLLAVLEERMLAKLFVIIGNDLNPSPWHAVNPVEDLQSLAHFTKLYQRAHQVLSLPKPYNTTSHSKISSGISCCQLVGCSEILCMHNPPHTLHFKGLNASPEHCQKN